MNANAWAALGMSVTNASRPEDWKKKNLFQVCLIQSEPRVSVRHAFIRQWSFQAPFPSVRFVLYFRFHCLRFIYSIKSVMKLCDSYLDDPPGTSEEWFPVKDFKSNLQNWSLPEYALEEKCLPVLRKWKSVAKNMGKEMLHSCMNQPRFLFGLPSSLHLALLSSQCNLSLSQPKLKAKAWMDLRGL